MANGKLYRFAKRREAKTVIKPANAWVGSVDISINKAWTEFFGIHVSDHGRVMIFAGGIPLKREGKAVGAIAEAGEAAL